MDDFLQLVYVSEIKAQCRFALSAMKSLNDALEVVQGPRRAEMHPEVFRQSHSLLTHASNVSRLFWPPAVRSKKGETGEQFQKRQAFSEVRGRTLRNIFVLSDSSPLKSRILRDHLEHYDERLDEWSITSVNRSLLSDTIAPAGSIVGVAPSDSMRWFDPTAASFRFRGEEFKLQPLVSEIGYVDFMAPGLRESLIKRLAAQPPAI